MAYEPIHNYGLIGDMNAAALVSRRGSIDWLCLSEFAKPSRGPRGTIIGCWIERGFCLKKCWVMRIIWACTRNRLARAGKPWGTSLKR